LALGAGLGATEAKAGGPAPVTFTTLNVRWFGLGGDRDGDGVETRQASIRQYLGRSHALADVMAFEEIVDVAALESEVLPHGYACVSYEHPDPKHQHVVLCTRGGYRIEQAGDDDDFILEDVAMEDKRPAVHGILKAPDGTALAHVLAVHLKASPIYQWFRKEQIRRIGAYLEARADQLPVVLFGDFNAYNDDAQIFGDELAPMGLAELPIAARFTFRTGGADGFKLDRIFLSDAALAAEPPRVLGPCNESRSQVAAIKRYYKAVSDHCPVTFALDLH
jgi:endonuclease/exonuclease/phosphatase family metal-dependent hydrolase